MSLRDRTLLLILQNAPYILFVVLLLVFGSLSDRFLSPDNFRNIVIQAAPIGILAIGLTFVLLTANIDLSVGGIIVPRRHHARPPRRRGSLVARAAGHDRPGAGRGPLPRPRRDPPWRRPPSS